MLRSVVCVATAVLLLSCEDEKSTAVQPPTAPVPVAVAVAPDGYAMLSQVKAFEAKSRVCFGYLRQRTKLLAQLKKAPSDTALLQKAEHVAAMLTDACN